MVSITGDCIQFIALTDIVGLELLGAQYIVKDAKSIANVTFSLSLALPVPQKLPMQEILGINYVLKSSQMT